MLSNISEAEASTNSGRGVWVILEDSCCRIRSVNSPKEDRVARERLGDEDKVNSWLTVVCK
eukprot:scaffold208218_cov36-Tisochrysis_lutea.AAC.1